MMISCLFWYVIDDWVEWSFLFEVYNKMLIEDCIYDILVGWEKYV